MNGLRVLITNMTLASRTGTETYLRDLALALLRAGHHPTVYCPDLGELAHELRMATIPVIDDLDRQANPPDVIHGNHHAETMTALLRFPGVPAVYFCHAWLAPVAAPPRFPRILRYVAVDQTCRDRLVDEHGIPADRVRVLLHTVDLERFRARGPLPERPGKALVFSNYANDQTHLGVVRQACERAGLTLDVCGAGVGASSDSPETRLREYDLVFAKGRCAQEALAVGCAVVLCDSLGAGPLVTADAYEQLRRLNFGARAMPHRSGADFLFGEISRYDARDAAQVTERLRATAGLEGGAREHIALYSEVLAESRSAGRANPHEEGRAAASYLRGITTFARDLRDYERRARLAEEERDRLRAERLQADRLQAQPRLPAVPPRGEWLRSGLCKQSELDSEAFRIWTARMRLCHKPHRKLWEYGFIAQALFERGLLRPGSCGLGFAVGQEPLVSLFAGFGCDIVATDLDEERARSAGWVTTNQHAAGLEALNAKGLCDPAEFRRRVSFRVVDMNAIRSDLRDFDFIWSSCSFEHLGSIAHGKRFIDRMMRCLKPGGVAVHTTEFNVSSNTSTIDDNPSFVIFRRCDIEAMAADATAAGHHLAVDFAEGDGPADRFVDQPPYKQETHLKLQIGEYVSTSIGLIVTAGEARAPAPSAGRWWTDPWKYVRRKAA